ncbi:hypothetical protein HMPREF9418_0008 [Neisseria macacae ATCC 33926]|uniref:Uncharacterized protein n=2 Tax=Neisseria macacae ATCC 33926 TaxID=997348 RepID=A0AA36XLV6_9NEIS|nr:hypothetical protein HMPREF9418_0008 [Neisseria macacae ATCC 33926]
MNNFQIFLFLGILMMLLTILLYKKGWVKPVQPAESDSRPPIFWISITVVVMLGIISLIRWMGW